MKTTIITLASIYVLFAAPATVAREMSTSTTAPVANDEVRSLCVEITNKQAGHTLRDCMASVDAFLERHAVPRSTP